MPLQELFAAREKARELLLAQNPAVFPVAVRKLRLPEPVLFESLQNFCRLTNASMASLCAGSDCLRDGCTFFFTRQNGAVQPLVLYNDREPNPRRLSFTLAHEVGHILLGHRRDGDREEALANAFAAELLIPRVLAGELVRRFAWAQPAGELAEIFGVSLAAARRCAADLARPQRPFATEERLLLRYGPLLPEPGPQAGF